MIRLRAVGRAYHPGTMLSRYRIQRGKAASGGPPRHEREDTRKHTRHCLRPERAMVERYLADPSASAWEEFRRAYLGLLRRRFKSDRRPFDALADRARRGDVYLGCNCPTRRNPDPARCHTIAALAFMRETYPDLDVVFPPGVSVPDS